MLPVPMLAGSVVFSPTWQHKVAAITCGMTYKMSICSSCTFSYLYIENTCAYDTS